MLSFVTLLAVFFVQNQILAEPTLTITTFETNPGVLFENLGNIHLHSSQWKLVTYYDLASYNAELQGLRECLSKIQKLCVQLKVVDPKNNNCIMISKLLDSHMLEIINYHNALFPPSSLRSRRALMDIGGTVLHYAFGVLDQQSADQYDDKIMKMQTDQNYLRELIKNQTLIIETSHHIIRHTNETLNHQFATFQRHLNQIDINANWDKLRSTLNNDLNAINAYATLVLSRFKDTQESLFNTLTNTNLGVVHPLILPPHILQEQLKNIQNHVPTHLTLPRTENGIDIKTIFSLTQIKSRLSNNKLILEIGLPLVSTENYQLFKMIPVPFKVGNHYAYVRSIQNFLIVNLLRDRYTTLNSNEFNQCSHPTDGAYICKSHQPIYTMGSKAIPCEIELLNHPQTLPSSCKLTVTEKQKFWIPISGNKFVFVLDEPTFVDIICEPKINHIELKGSGMTLIPNGCRLKDGDVILTPEIFQNSSVQSSYVPSVKMNLNQSEIESRSSYKSSKIPNIPYDPISEEYFNHLIDQQKQSEKALPSSLNGHDITHYTTNVILFISLSIIVGLLIANRLGYPLKRCGRKTKTVEISTPVAIYSIPAPVHTNNPIQAAPRTTISK